MALLRVNGKFCKKGKINQLKNLKNQNQGKLKDIFKENSDVNFRVPNVESEIQTVDIADSQVHIQPVVDKYKTPNFRVEGRRIIDIDFFANKLFCKCCKSPLQLNCIVREVVRGLSGWFLIRCLKCGAETYVPLGKQHSTPSDNVSNPEDVSSEKVDTSRAKGNGSIPFDINSKAAIGMINCGLGHTHVNSFLRELNLPGISHRTLKKREREISNGIMKAAEESCLNALEQEVKATINANVSTSIPVVPSTPTRTPSTPLLSSKIVTSTPIVTSCAEGISNIPNVTTPCVISTPTLSSTPLAKSSEIVTPGPPNVLSTPRTLNPIVTPNVSNVANISTPKSTPAITVPPTSNTTASNMTPVITVPPTPNTALAASFDAGWSKRGTGRSYNSNTGHAALIGEQTGKIIKFDVKSKVCDMCRYHKDKGTPIPAHNCCKNWTGSSKAMEPALACTMIQELQNDGHSMNKLIMDNDATTMAHVREKFGDSIKKCADKNHSTKSIIGGLFNLSQKHKMLRNKQTRNYIKRNIVYAIDQCQNEPDKLSKRLNEVIPHMYGNHELCDSDWCSYNSNPDGFRYKWLPYKKPLRDQALKADLEILIQKQIKNAEQLSNQGSSQNNESFNNMIAAKAPKSRRYGHSESMTTRVAAAATQKNEGYDWTSKVHEKAGLSPGYYNKLNANHLKRKREWLSLREGTKEVSRKKKITLFRLLQDAYSKPKSKLVIYFIFQIICTHGTVEIYKNIYFEQLDPSAFYLVYNARLFN